MVDSDFSSVSVVSVVSSVPKCLKKKVFTRYIDTENNNIYISDIVGKCNRIDKCGYHYTPHQYFTDNPWKRDNLPREDGSRHCSPVLYHRVRERENREHPLALPPAPTGYIPEWVWERSRTIEVLADHVRWMASICFGTTLTNKNS